MTEKVKSNRRQRTRVVALRLLPGEYDALTKAARDRGISLSELLRSSALAFIGEAS